MNIIQYIFFYRVIKQKCGLSEAIPISVISPCYKPALVSGETVAMKLNLADLNLNYQ